MRTSGWCLVAIGCSAMSLNALAGESESASAPALIPDPIGAAGPSPVTNPIPTQDDFLPISDRWRIGFPPGYLEESRGSKGLLWNPYNQNVLKGDYPVIGDDKFLVVTLISDTLMEARKLPVPSGVSSLRPGSFDFFGQGDQFVIQQTALLGIELFQGDTAFKPRDWELRATMAMNVNYVNVNESQLVNVDVSEGQDRFDENFGFQELFAEKHIADLSSNYDFWAVRAGIQAFNADFRGFLFADNEPGVRVFGSYDNNRIQYNLAWFTMLEKDTNSGLNTFNHRDQNVFVGNVYRQDFIVEGYTIQLLAAANIDQSDAEFDNNGVLVRPAPVGSIEDKEVNAYYVGIAGDGKIGRLNVSHQYYEVFGRESFNPIAGQETTISARMFAMELSYDSDWIRYRASFQYASGDDDPTDSRATGFDSIFDNPNFAGGAFSYYTRQAIRLTGSGVNLVGRNSNLNSLRTSKEQGQANFVNPGLFLYNAGVDFDVTPKLKVFTNVSYLQFEDPEALRLILNDNGIEKSIGWDLSIGFQYRPLLNNNMIINGGIAALVPGEGFKQLYTSETLYSGFIAFTVAF